MTKDYMFNPSEFKLPEDLGQTAAHSMLDEIFNGGVIDASNQTTLLMLMALSTGDNISQAKLCRVTQQSVQLLRNLKAFFNTQFKIKECDDDVFSDSESENEEGE
jgi:RNA 3'-terminal phosphate cyclase